MSTDYTEAGLKRMTNERLDKVLADFGLVRTKEDTKDDLVKIILEQQAAAKYKAQEDKELAQGKESIDKSLMGDQSWLDDRVQVIFDEAAGKTGKMPINVGLNGVAFQIPRNTEVSLPRAVLNSCIGDARQTLFEPEGDSQGRVQMNQREVPRFTYRVIRDPAPADSFTPRKQQKRRNAA